MSIRGWWSARAGVRLRLTVAATLLAAVTVGLAGLLLLVLLGRSLDATASTRASQRAQEVAALLTRGGLPAVVSVLTGVGGESTSTQVLGRGHRVVASSPQVRNEKPLTTLVVGPGVVSSERLTNLPVGDGAAYVVVSRGVRHEGADYQVVVAQSLATTASSVRTVGTLLLIGLPLLTAASGLATFVFVGRALQPVAAMRRQVAKISATDLTQRLPLPATHDEVHDLGSTMNEMLARLEAAQDRQRRFVADASHELRSPLATVKANLQLTRDGTDPDWSEAHAMMLVETERLERIVSDLLLLAHGDAEAGVAYEDVDLEEIVFAEVEHLRRTTTLDVVVSAGSAVRVTGDAHQLSQVLRNLADNAAVHASHRIDITLAVDLDHAVLEVGDDGPGIPVADRRRVLERFVRLDAGRDRASGGTGLGLAIVDDVVQRHGGTVTVTASPAGGVLVRVVLPRQV